MRSVLVLNVVVFSLTFGKVGVTFDIGLTSSNMDLEKTLQNEIPSTEGISFNRIYGLNLNLGYSFYFSDKIALQTGIGFSQRGAAFEVDSSEAEVKLEFIYVPVPVYIQYDVTNFAQIYAGPEIGFRVGSNNSYEPEYKNMDYGVGVGLKLIKTFSGSDLGVYLSPSYYHGLQENFDYPNATGGKFNNFDINIGFNKWI